MKMQLLLETLRQKNKHDELMESQMKKNKFWLPFWSVLILFMFCNHEKFMQLLHLYW